MRRILMATVAVATAAASATALAAAPPAGRQVSKAYTVATTAVAPNGQAQGSGLVLQGVGAQRTYGLAYIRLRPSDRAASLRITDQTGRIVQAVVQQTQKNGSVVQVGVFCGGTSKPLRLLPGGGTLVVRPSYGMCGQQPSMPTTGEITGTLR